VTSFGDSLIQREQPVAARMDKLHTMALLEIKVCLPPGSGRLRPDAAGRL